MPDNDAAHTHYRGLLGRLEDEPRSLTYDELQTLHAFGATLGPLTEQEDRAMTYDEIMAREAR